VGTRKTSNAWLNVAIAASWTLLAWYFWSQRDGYNGPAAPDIVFLVSLPFFLVGLLRLWFWLLSFTALRTVLFVAAILILGFWGLLLLRAASDGIRRFVEESPLLTLAALASLVALVSIYALSPEKE
jgi:hypothetical protein